MTGDVMGWLPRERLLTMTRIMQEIGAWRWIKIVLLRRRKYDHLKKFKIFLDKK